MSKDEARRRLLKAREDPAWFVKHVLGADLWGKQTQIIESVRDNRETSVRSAHACGKSFIAARTALWFACAYPKSITITTAPTDRQVRGILWKEIAAAHASAKIPLGGKLTSKELKWLPDWFMLGFTAPDYDPDRFQGWHAERVLVIVDEASGVSSPIFDAISSIASSEHARVLYIGNPTDPSGDFAKSFKTPGTSKIKISAFDTPNLEGITPEDIESGAWESKRPESLPRPYLVSPEWVADRMRRWGKESPMFRSRILAEFPEDSHDTLIPLAWVERAQDAKLRSGDEDQVELGVDVARFGGDETVLVARCGQVARIHKIVNGLDTMEVVGAIIHAAHETGAKAIKVDSIGVGAGVVDRLRENKMPVFEANASKRAFNPVKFANSRAEWYWTLRELFEAGKIDIDDEEMASQLATIRYKIDSSGRILIESKDDMRKRGVSSPDRADALAYAFAALQQQRVWVM